jgi:hypothetical protein
MIDFSRILRDDGLDQAITTQSLDGIGVKSPQMGVPARRKRKRRVMDQSDAAAVFAKAQEGTVAGYPYQPEEGAVAPPSF